MLQFPKATPSPISTTSASFETSVLQSYESTEEVPVTQGIQNVELRVSPTRTKSVRSQTWSESLVDQCTKAISNGAAQAKHLSDHVRFNAQTKAHNSVDRGAVCQLLLPARRGVSVLPSERHPTSSTAPPIQGNGINRHVDKHTRKNPRRRTIWVPSDDTTILKIHPGVQSGPKFLLRGTNQPDAGKRGQRKPLAAAPKRAALQPARKHLQESIDQHDSYVSI